ncbi:MAG TPA: FAD-dependent monooxygenase [Pseudonocardiaceae bacterium]|jgi:2-polyprenyl-6-methoxyphenol hydroxylase-like FAD-dependent oxidoreductase
MATEHRETEVVVVGAGPVGLMLAGELRLAGIDVIVLDELAEPMSESRASQLNARTMEILDQRGLLDVLDRPEREKGGHFGGIPLPVDGLDSVHSGHWKIPQYRTEAALWSWAGELGAVLLRGHRLTELDVRRDDVETVTVSATGSLRVRARYLVGCDGEHSTVRQLAGFDFAGQDATKELLRADVSGVDIPDRRFERLERGLAIAATRGGVTRVMMHRFGAQARDRAGPPTFEEISTTWADITGEDIGGGQAVWTDAFDNTTRQATEYRRGRVLLAGDAAHRMMPVGGQALNIGLQDAVNLGWKLAAQVRGRAGADLLDSYHDERHPTDARVLANVEAQALLLLGDQRTDATRNMFTELLRIDTVRRHLGELVSGLDVRYDVGPGEHPLLGARMPHRAKALRSGRGVLLDPGTDEFRATAAKWSDRVDVVPATPDGDAGAALVRPDGHVAWIDGTHSDLHTALDRWFGPPKAA